MGDWWEGIDAEILGYLAVRRTMTCDEIGSKLGMSEAGVGSILAMLVEEGKIRISLVEIAA